MCIDIHPKTVRYEHRGYEATIELRCSIPNAAGPDHITISISRSGSWAHTMRLSSSYGSTEEAVAAAQILVRHYVSGVCGSAK